MEERRIQFQLLDESSELCYLICIHHCSSPFFSLSNEELGAAAVMIMRMISLAAYDRSYGGD